MKSFFILSMVAYLKTDTGITNKSPSELIYHTVCESQVRVSKKAPAPVVFTFNLTTCFSIFPISFRANQMSYDPITLPKTNGQQRLQTSQDPTSRYDAGITAQSSVCRNSPSVCAPSCTNAFHDKQLHISEPGWSRRQRVQATVVKLPRYNGFLYFEIETDSTDEKIWTTLFRLKNFPSRYNHLHRDIHTLSPSLLKQILSMRKWRPS